jgi:hypothetical protein
MRFECSACQHLGEAAQVVPADGGVALICAACGHGTRLGGAPSPPPAAPSPSPSPALAPDAAAPAPVAPARPAAAAMDPVAVIRKQGLTVDPGSGPERCPKCGYRQGRSASCVRCGVDWRGLGGRVAPWEEVPPGKEAAAAELERRWLGLLEGEEMLREEAREAVVHYAVEHGLLDRLSRRFRFYAQDHHGTARGEAAALSLGSIVEKMHAAFLVGAGQGSRGQVEEGVKRVQVVLYVVVGLMCLGLLALVALYFAPR